MEKRSLTKILLVDDEIMVLKIQKQMLERHEYQCFLAQDSSEAIAYMNSEPISLVVLDINLKGESGIELLKEMKENYPDTAVIMATGNDDYEIAMDCMKLGADDYLAKPFPEGKLVISVRNVITMKQLYLDRCNYQKNLEEKLCQQKEELKASQSMLIQQEKLAAIGQLAAGVAHEINNPLGYISSNLSSLSKYKERLGGYLTDLDEIHTQLLPEVQQVIKGKQKKYKIKLFLEDFPEVIVEAQEGIQRMKKIVDGLKCFARTDGDLPVPVDLTDCLESAITVVWNEIKYNCKLDKNFGELPIIKGFPQQLSQVFMNLLVNASHAIDKDGLIQLDTQQLGNLAVIKITDNGSGIAAEHLDRIFDPFFTTKEVGKGTGLGMSIAREIIEKHNGEICAKSTVGIGTTFTVTLPV